MQTCDFLNMLFTPAILKGVFQWKGKNSILTINHTNHKRLWGTYKRVVPKEEEWLACVDQLMILFCLWCEQIWWNYGKQFEITFFYYCRHTIQAHLYMPVVGNIIAWNSFGHSSSLFLSYTTAIDILPEFRILRIV